MDQVQSFLVALLANPLFIGAIGGILAAARVDYEAFKTWESPSQAYGYDWLIATWRWFKGGVIGLVSALAVSGVGRLVGAVVLSVALLGATGCAKVNPALVAAQTSVHEGVQKVDAEVRRVCLNVNLAAPCTDIRPLVLELVKAGQAFSQSVLDQKIAGLTDIIVAGGRLGEKVKALPRGETVQIVMELAKVITEASLAVGR